eukprot:6202135-Pleurochrysis_carterae.AAC.4
MAENEGGRGRRRGGREEENRGGEGGRERKEGEREEGAVGWIAGECGRRVAFGRWRWMEEGSKSARRAVSEGEKREVTRASAKELNGLNSTGLVREGSREGRNRPWLCICATVCVRTFVAESCQSTGCDGDLHRLHPVR